MRKEIIIPHYLMADLKLVAFTAGKSVKKLMEDVIIAHIKATAKILKAAFP